MDLGLEGSVVVITGGTDGLGVALARRLVLEGAAVAICSRRSDAVTAACEELIGLSSSQQVLGLVVDVTDPTAIEEFALATLARFGRVDGLVNNAGQSAAQGILDVDDAAWQADLDLKLFAAIRTTRAFAEALKASQGTILNVLAISGKHPGASTAPTSISRAAGLAFTKATSKDLGPFGVTANAILVGFIESGQWVRRAEAAGITMDHLAEQVSSGMGIPLGRMGRAEEFADLAAFLLSARARYLSGVGINLDGGLSSAV